MIPPRGLRHWLEHGAPVDWHIWELDWLEACLDTPYDDGGD